MLARRTSHSSGRDHDPAPPDAVAHSAGRARVVLSLPSPKQLSWHLLRELDDLDPNAAAVVARVLQDEEAARVIDLGRRFCQIVRSGGGVQAEPDIIAAFDAWLSDAPACGVRVVESFATCLGQDGAAVRAGLRLPWSSGQAEGQINRLKLLKHAMYPEVVALDALLKVFGHVCVGWRFEGRWSANDRMASSRKTVSLDNLTALGAPRLAAILVDLAAGNAEVKRRLRLELAGQAGEDSMAVEIGKRLTTIRSARSFIDWRKRKDFIRDLDLQRAMIADRLAATRPDLALGLMWRFLDLAEPVLDRVDDSNGSVGDVFRIARANLGMIATKAKPDPVNFAERALAAMLTNEYGIYDGLVPIILPVLGDAGVEHLKHGLTQASSNRKAGDRAGRADAARRALQDIADAQSDVDAYRSRDWPPAPRCRPSDRGALRIGGGQTEAAACHPTEGRRGAVSRGVWR